MTEKEKVTDKFVSRNMIDSFLFIKALASPSLIALSSKDPIITAFQLSDELKRLAVLESQFKEEYAKLRKIVQEFAVGLVEQARTSYELEVFLNHNPDGAPWKPGLFCILSAKSLFRLLYFSV